MSDIHLCGQDQVPPVSYKIQLGYVHIPKTIKMDARWMDTPYRFTSFGDANQQANQIFTGYSYRIVGSNDRPHVQAPSYLLEPRPPIRVNPTPPPQLIQKSKQSSQPKER
jgi:hypothetical protein